jgi:Domain of unknown function (DUF4115)
LVVPETRGEWIVFGLALCGLGVIVALIVLKETHTAVPLVHSEGRSAGITAGFATTANTTTTATGDTGTTAPSGAPAGARLVLTASRGDTWIAVRSGSARGPVVFQGTLAKGSSKTFIDPTIWVRFGAASNVDALLNGKPLGLPVGTVSIVITPHGLG